ncbi:13923_t:CDS:2, partial [Gigaspora rosea]
SSMVQMQSSKYQTSKQEKDTFTANSEMVKTLEAENIEVYNSLMDSTERMKVTASALVKDV